MTDYKFIVDANVGKLAKWLRMMGYDAIFFEGEDDAEMVKIAFEENRVILTRDTGIMKRKLITGGQVKAVLFKTDDPVEQMQQLIETLDLEQKKPFSQCLVCNQPLGERTKEEVKDRVPPYVYKTQGQYMECPQCRRIYWRGTHRSAMTKDLKKFVK